PVDGHSNGLDKKHKAPCPGSPSDYRSAVPEPPRIEIALTATERWFVARGLPHFVERRDTVWVIWSRAIPLLVVAYVALGLNALEVADHGVPERDRASTAAASVVPDLPVHQR